MSVHNEGGGAFQLVSSSPSRSNMHESDSELEDDMIEVEEMLNPPNETALSPLPPIEPVNSGHPRLKVYPENAAGPFIVFFRPIEKRLNIISISRTLSRSFEGVTSITQVRPDKLRVVVASRSTANKIVASEHFNLEYRVYIPSNQVEIDGVFSYPGITLSELLTYLKGGRPRGVFKNPAVKPVTVLDCRQLYAVSLENGSKSYKESGQFRVTFAGSTLPDYLELENARLPVRLFVPRPMNCRKCIRLGHTETHCCNKARCSKCGENHGDEACAVDTAKCVYCNGDESHDLATCPAYKLRADKLKRSVQQRSKRTFAEILRQTNPPAPPKTIIQNGNIYALLPSDEQVPDDPNAGFPPLLPKNPRKRGNESSSPRLPRKNPRTTQPGMEQPQENADRNPEKIPPGLSADQYDKGNPQSPGTSKTPDSPVLVSNPKPSSGLFVINDIINGILDFFNVSDSLRIIICALTPLLKTYLKQLSLKWPLLASIVSFDD